MLRRANVVYASSEAEVMWLKTFIGKSNKRNSSRLVVIPLGIIVPTLEGQWTQKTQGDQKRILCLGRLHPLKGLELLLEAWMGLKQSGEFLCWNLTIAGPDVQLTKRRLQTMIETLRIDGVELKDGTFGSDKWQLVCTSDLFVLPSRSENFGIVVGEALACGVPVVMTDVGPWKTEMEKCFGRGVSNAPIQFVETSAPGIADGLSKMMTLDDETRAEMGRNGQAWIRKEFQWKRVAERMIEVYAN